ncbi:MAG: hypothetical protein JST67_03460 [Bacteroidetes bacterium]|nr:hypothetical protein [Bacteroidota bacterium]
MKKIIYSASIMCLASSLFVTGCKKDTTPFPTNSQSNSNPYSDYSFTTPYFPTLGNADAILVAARVSNTRSVIVSPVSFTYEYGMAKFAASTGNFTNLLNIGNITLNDSNLANTGANYYLSSINSYSINLSGGVVWNVAGTNYTIANPMPSYTYAPNLWDTKWMPVYPVNFHNDIVRPAPSNPLSATDIVNYPGMTFAQAVNAHKADSTQRNKDSLFNILPAFGIPLKNYLSNADSISLVMTDGAGFTFVKTFPASDTVAYVYPKDFANSPSTYNNLSFITQLNAYKYQSMPVSGKNYCFLNLASYMKYNQATK